MAIYTISLYIAWNDVARRYSRREREKRNRLADLYEGRGDNSQYSQFWTI